MWRKHHNISILLLYFMLAVFQQQAMGQATVKQGNPVPVNFCIKDSEMKLYQMVNEYRERNNLPAVPLSKSLCYVAALHAKDLMFFHPDQGSCNFHSWSNKGIWKAFCYPGDETKKASVWDKPRELTTYPAKAYEIVYWENSQMVPDSIITVWKTEDYFNNYLLNSGKWQNQPWNAIGIAIFENYVCAWFGTAADPEGSTYVCGTKPVPAVVKDTAKIPAPVKKPAATKSKPVKTHPVKPAKADSTVAKSVKPAAKVQPSVDSSIVASAQSGDWYIIVKTNLPMESARKLVDELRANEYPQAQVLEKDGKTRISIFGPADKPAAALKLKEVKKVYKDAWLLKE